ncbi:MAG: hypothetical protein PHD04_04685, partial [Candidatus Pacebacteria bacterium]|nr:hypothetical protein [Candidatus Paceibacterota bacterium]
MQNELVRYAAYTGAVAALVTIIATGGAPLVGAIRWVSGEAQTAAVFFVPSITVAQINADYHGVQFGDTIITASPVPAEPARKVRILIMPGHQPDKGGTIFG